VIKAVVKRDGSAEPFDPSKINNMAIWAVGTNNVTWSDIAISALRNLGDVESVTAQDIQNSLVKTCIDREDFAHNLIAGRLFLGSLRKESFAAKRFADHYYEMQDAGLYREMAYTEEEVEQLGEIVDNNYDRDLNYGYATLRQFSDKYALRDGEGRLLELPQYMYMGIAMSMMEGETLENVVMYYEKASQQKINLPSPVLSQQRTPNNTGVSCVITTAGDTLHGIEASKHIAFMATASSAGLGVEYDVRSVGDDVRNGYATAGGKLPHYRVLDKTVKEVKQSSRGGSATVSFKVIDPEIETLLVLKLKRSPETKRIDQLDYSVLWNNDFLRRAAKKQPWALVSKVECPELWDSFSDDSRFTEIMDKVLDSPNIKKKVVNAFDILSTYIDNRLETGRIYRTNLTEVNLHTPFKEEVRLSNLCVAPETQILTDKGYIPIAELVDQDVRVWNGREFSDTVVRQTGTNQKLLKVTTSSGQTLECTEYHKWYVAEGYTGRIHEKRTYELKSGDKLIKFDLPIIEGENTLDLAYQNGFFSADGSVVGGQNRVYFYHDKRKLVPMFNLKSHCVQENQNREYGYVVGLRDKFFVPDGSYTIQSRLQWLAGYLDGDGCVCRNGTNQQLVATSVEPEFLREIQRMLQTLGLSSKVVPMSDEGVYPLPANDGSGDTKDYFCRKAERILISSCDVYRLMEIGLGKYLKRLQVTKRLPQRDAKQFVKVVNVVDEGRYDDTYCFTEPKRGMGMFNGILTGQCQEVLLPTKPYNHITELYKNEYNEGDGMTAQCFLSAIDVAKIESDEDYEEAAYIALLSLDNLIEDMSYPFPQFKVTAQAYRSVGVGITNLAYYLAKEGKTYSDVGTLHWLAERHYYFLLKASVRIAKERGSFLWIHKTKWADGWLPIDTYNRNIDNVIAHNTQYDWESLRMEVLRYGVRFSTLSAFMPCESSSVFGNSTNSLYPIRDRMVYKDSKKGKVQFFAPYVDTLKYEYAWDVDPYVLLNMYGIFQKWCDQTISADTYVRKVEGEKLSKAELVRQHLYSNKIGMKTLYYNNTRSGRGEGSVIQAESECESCSL